MLLCVLLGALLPSEWAGRLVSTPCLPLACCALQWVLVDFSGSFALGSTWYHIASFCYCWCCLVYVLVFVGVVCGGNGRWPKCDFTHHMVDCHAKEGRVMWAAGEGVSFKAGCRAGPASVEGSGYGWRCAFPSASLPHRGAPGWHRRQRWQTCHRVALSQLSHPSVGQTLALICFEVRWLRLVTRSVTHAAGNLGQGCPSARSGMGLGRCTPEGWERCALKQKCHEAYCVSVWNHFIIT